MSKILKNQTASPVDITDTGVTVPASGQYVIPPQDYPLWAASSDAVTEVGNGTIVVNDGSADLSISDGIDLIKGIFRRFIISSPTIAHQTATLADVEYSYSLPSGTRQFTVKVLGDSKVKYSFTASESGTLYDVLYPGAVYKEMYVNPSSSLTLYFQTSKDNETLVITSWT